MFYLPMLDSSAIFPNYFVRIAPATVSHVKVVELSCIKIVLSLVGKAHPELLVETAKLLVELQPDASDTKLLDKHLH